MPIFIKDNRLVYFAHIPKNAGTSIYHAFAYSGWSIFNVTPYSASTSTYMQLLNCYSIDCSKKLGNIVFNINSLQHSPSLLWKRWACYDESFAVIRDPLDRFQSSLKYHYKYLNHGCSNFYSFCFFVYNVLRFTPLSSYLFFDSHYLPQSFFISPETCLYRYSSCWQDQLIDRYQLHSIPIKNSSPNVSEQIPKKLLSFAARFYSKDILLYESLQNTLYS